MGFEVGQRVGYLYERGYGIIQSLDKKEAVVLDENGFDRKVPVQELVFIHSDNYTQSVDVTLTEKDKSEADEQIRKFEERTGQRQSIQVWEIDLHIESLVESHSGLSNTEIMLRQMASFRQSFQKAKKQRINKLTVIHGVGEGVLKNEIRTYLAQQEQIEVYDADYANYGKGATTIEFHPNWTS